MATPQPKSSTRVIAGYNRGLLVILSIFFIVPLSLYLSILASFISATMYLRLFPTIVTGLLFMCGIATITYVTYHSFLGQVVTIGSTFKSLRYSFLPLILTTVIALVIATFSAYIFKVTSEFIGLGRHKFLLFDFIALLALLILHLQVHCALAVAVNESNRSFQKLWFRTKRLFSLKFRTKRLFSLKSKSSPPLRSVVMYFALGSMLKFEFSIGDEPAIVFSGWQVDLMTLFYAAYIDLNLMTLFYTAYIALLLSTYISAIAVMFLYLRPEEEDTLKSEIQKSELM